MKFKITIFHTTIPHCPHCGCDSVWKPAILHLCYFSTVDTPTRHAFCEVFLICSVVIFFVVVFVDGRAFSASSPLKARVVNVITSLHNNITTIQSPTRYVAIHMVQFRHCTTFQTITRKKKKATNKHTSTQKQNLTSNS